MAKFTKQLMLNSILLAHASKNSEMKSDLNAILAQDNLTVDGLLKMQGEKFLDTNANEVMGTAQTGFGEEFVEKEIMYSEVLARITDENSLITEANIKTMFADVETFPAEGADVFMVNTTEATSKAKGTTPAGQNQKAGTLNFTITAKDLVVTIEISDQLVRRSVVDIANYVLNKIAKAFESTIHELALNGDTATAANTNINAIDGAVADLPKGGAKAATLNNDGVRKLAFEKGAAVDAGGNLDLSIIRSARAKMGAKGLKPTDLKLAVEQSVYFNLLGLSQVETVEKFGQAATVVNGVLTAIDGMKIVPREELVKVNATGKLSKTASNNTKGQAVIVYVPSVNVGVREGLSTENQRYASEKITAVTGSAVAGVTIEDKINGNPSAVIYNI